MNAVKMEVVPAKPYFFGDIGFWAERTDVHKAAAQGHVPELQRLIRSGASVNMVAVDSITPLHEACIQGQAQCVRLLLDAGAQVDARNVDGSTPLCDACAAGSLECIKLLLEHGATVNPALTSRTTSPLHEACIGGNPDCVQLLITGGAHLEAYELYFGTPLHVACANEQVECAKALLRAGAKVNAARLHETALHHAARVKNMELVEMLVEFGGNVYARDNLGKKPIDYTGPGSPTAACLRFYESTPLSLQQLSRVSLRTALGTRTLEAVSNLSVPNRIIKYLSYC
ncbi:ankyrin repeat and SOCS box protein 13 [Brienomyrus brachyistius]|uniref:ankyrin repeat and SOCS box protein 13 n=1 Tax=Brienomyrus brachyistius TaxID=42636 RepID=UPI0020B42945|nr:ankyrin repeat and SOCS box protein 13 [Brienomyrus brachyistius]